MTSSFSFFVLLTCLTLFNDFSYGSQSLNATGVFNSSCSQCYIHSTSKSRVSSGSLSTKSPVSSSLGVGSYILQGLGTSSTELEIDVTSKAAFISTLSTSPNATQNSTLPFSSSKNLTIPLSGANSSESARSCASALQSYSAASDAWFSNNSYSTTQTFLPSAEVTTTYNYTITTLCDGIPRAINPSPVIYTNKGRGYQEPQVLAPPYPVTTPCTLGTRGCEILQSVFTSDLASYGAALDAYDSCLSSQDQDRAVTDSSRAFACNVSGEITYPTEPTPPACSFTVCSTCNIIAQSVRLLYWPSTAVPNNHICPNTTELTTFTAEPTGIGPNTQDFDGTILTSPTAYMSFGGVVVSWCSNQSTIKTNTLLPVNPSDVSSLRSVPWPGNEPFPGLTVPYINYDGPYPFNYGDLNTPMPYSAYSNVWFCFGDAWAECPTMTPDRYAPILAYPKSFIQSVDPSLSTCVLQYAYAGVYDPPHALQQQPSAALPISQSPYPNPQTHTSSSGADKSTMEPSPSASAKPPPLPPTPSRTTQQRPTAPPTNIPNAEQQDPHPIPSGGPSGSDSNPPQDDPHRPVPAIRQPPGGTVSSNVNNDPKSDPGSDDEDDPDTTSPKQDSDPLDISSNSGDNQEDSGQSAGSKIAGIMNDPGRGPVGSPDQETNQNPGNVAVANVLGDDGSDNEADKIISMLSDDGSSSGTSGQDSGSFSDDSKPPNPPAIAIVGGQTMYRVPNDPAAIEIGKVTLHPGEQTRLFGTPISIGTDRVVVGSDEQASTISLAKDAAPDGASVATVTIGSRILTALQESSNAIVIGSQTASLGGTPVTVDGPILSFGSNGLVVDGSSTIPLSTPEAAYSRTMIKATAIIIPGSLTVFEENDGDMVVGAQTLSVGGPPLTINGHVLSDGSNRVVVDGSKTALWTPAQEVGLKRKETLITAPDGKVFTVFETSGATDAVVDGHTLNVGGADATIDEDVVSLASGGLVVNGSVTEVLITATTVQGSSLDGAAGSIVDVKSTEMSSPTSGVTASSTAASTASRLPFLSLEIVISTSLLAFLSQIYS